MSTGPATATTEPEAAPERSGAPAPRAAARHSRRRDLLVRARALARHPLSRRAAPWAVLAVALLAAGVLYVRLSRRLWFFQDDWDFLLTRGNVPGANRGLWEPHGDHWSTGPILVYRGLFAVFGLTSYLPWAVVTVAVHLVVCVLVAVLLRRLGTGAWTAALVGVGLAFLGAGAEVWFVDNAMNHTLSLAFALGALLVAVRPLGERRVLAVWALMVASLLCSGTGVTGTVLVVAFVLTRHGARASLRVLAVPLLAFVYWFVEYGRGGNGGVLDPPTLYLDVPRFVWFGLTHALDATVLVTGAGTLLLLVVLAAPLVRSTAPAALRQAAVAGILAAVAQMTLVGVSRIGFGPEIAATSRYVYITMVLLAPAVALLLHLVATRVDPSMRWAARGVAALVVGACVVNGVGQSVAYARGQESLTSHWRDRMLALVVAADAGERVLTPETEDWLNADLDPALVVSPAIRAALPREQPTALGRLDAEATFMTGVRASEYGAGAPARILPAGGFDALAPRGRPAPGCQGYRAVAAGATLELRSVTGAEIGLTGPARQVRTQLVRGDVESSVVRTWPTTGRGYVATTARDAVLRLTLDAPGDYVVCMA